MNPYSQLTKETTCQFVVERCTSVKYSVKVLRIMRVTVWSGALTSL
jgi:hypothetical protein